MRSSWDRQQMCEGHCDFLSWQICACQYERSPPLGRRSVLRGSGLGVLVWPRLSLHRARLFLRLAFLFYLAPSMMCGMGAVLEGGYTAFSLLDYRTDKNPSVLSLSALILTWILSIPHQSHINREIGTQRARVISTYSIHRVPSYSVVFVRCYDPIFTLS